MVKITDVFTPNKVPTVTYVQRTENVEAAAKQALLIPNIIISLSGPSKSGKTTLVNKVVAKDHLIEVSGAAIKSADDLWTTVISWMGGPVERSVTTGRTVGGSVGVNTGGEFNALVAKGKIEGKADVKADFVTSETVKRPVNLVEQVRSEIADSDFVVFVDDFHYIPKEQQPEIGRQIKFAAEQGVKICTASVPHRSDDVVRSNIELRGRVRAVNIDFWSPEEQRAIAQTGFAALNMLVADEMVDRLVKEAFGSPQLMQIICLMLCMQQGVEETFATATPITLDDHNVRQVLMQTSAFMDYGTLVYALHAGPKQRGNERKIYEFVDGTRGDVYRSVLLAIAHNPPKLSLTYDEMQRRVNSIIATGDRPSGSSVAQALGQMHTIAPLIQPNATVIEWDEDVLDVVDPYFLFYLRSSSVMGDLWNQSSVNPKSAAASS